MSEEPKQAEGKCSNDEHPQDSSHPGMSSDPVERGKQLGSENAHGGHSVGTGGHGATSGNIGSGQPVGGKLAHDSSQFNQEQLHPGMNPDPVERGRLLGQQNAHGGHSVGTGGHGMSGTNSKK